MENFLREIPPFPLDVVTAAYYIKGTKTSYSKYLGHIKDYHENFAQTQADVITTANQYNKTRRSIVTLTLKRLEQLNPESGELLLFISLLDSQNIPKAVLSSYTDEVFLDKLMQNLRKYSLIVTGSSAFGDSYPTISVHRVNQKLSNSYLIKNLPLDKVKLALQKMVKVLDSSAALAKWKNDVPKMKLLNNHVKSFLENSKSLLSDEQTAILKVRIANVAKTLGEYHHSEQILNESVETFERTKNYSRVAWALTYLGSLNSYLGRYVEAEKILKKCIQLHKKYPSEPIRIATSNLYLGIVYLSTGQYEKSLPLLEKSYNIWV